MTNKDTERLVRGHMQQTIPDKDALWNRIESNLPAQPEMPRIRKSSGRHITRIIGAAACFLLVIGGVGVWSALGGHGGAKMETTNEAAMPQCADAPEQRGEAAAENAADAAADDACDAIDAEQYGEPAAENEFADYAGEQDINSGKTSFSGKPKDDSAQADGGQSHVITLRGYRLGETVYLDLDDGDAVITSCAGVLRAEPSLQLQEMIGQDTLDRAQTDGVLLTFGLDGEEITLMALDGKYRMIADGRVYHAPDDAQRLLESLEA